jgi:hypothetical protein
MLGGWVLRDTAGTRSQRPGVPGKAHAQLPDMTRHRAGYGWTFHGPAAGLRLTRRLGASPAVRSISLSPARPRSESHCQVEEFRAEDRHSPLPHIGPSTTALN